MSNKPPFSEYTFACKGRSCGTNCPGLLLRALEDGSCEHFLVFRNREDAQKEALECGIDNDHIVAVQVKQI